jgi:tetratricopeptide (TPR) repeat protein
MRSSTSAPPQPAGKIAVVSGLLFMAVCAVFIQSLRCPFINFDDPYYVSANERVLRGLSLDDVHWAFTHRHSNNWHPLTSMSHMLDCRLFGARAGGHHAVNLLLHAATAIGLFLILYKAAGGFWPAAAAAALFAVHPLHVESVAWVSERKDVLSGFCFALALWAYISYARRPFSVGKYLLVTLFFALGLLAKSMLVTLPIVLLLLDYWPLGRFQLESGATVGAFPWRPVWEKLPWLAIAAAFGLATIEVQAEFAMPFSVVPLRYRLAHMAVSYGTYLKQTIWPFDLALFYPYPAKGDSLTDAAVLACLLAAITLAAFYLRRDRPYLLFGWLWFLVTLLPAIGLVQVGLQAHADRYMYLPNIGLFVAIAWEMETLLAAQRRRSSIAGTLAAVTLAVLTIAANNQAALWRTSASLWRHAILHTARNDCAYGNPADVMREEGDFAEAARMYEKSMEINPKFPQGYDNLALCWQKSGEVDQSAARYSEALRNNGGSALFCRNIGRSLVRLGQVEAAIELWQAEVDRNVEDWMAIANDIAWLRATYPDKMARHGAEAEKLARQIVEATGGRAPETLDTLAAACAEEGRFAEARDLCEQAIELAREQHHGGLAAAIQKRLDGYRGSRPCRESPRDFPQRWAVQIPSARAALDNRP